MSAHTPGPWRVGIAAGTIVSDSGKIANAHCYGVVPDAEERANARLIAAAPDLLAALQRCVEAATDETPAIRGARAAIAAARGE